MSYQVLARKWRPRNFANLVGQEHVVRALTNALNSDRVHHAFVFTGTRGVGKTTIARIIAKCLNCESGVSATPCESCSACTAIDAGHFADLIEVDAASRSKVDETRDLMDNVAYAPAAGRYKVYLIDEVHMFSDKSFNALLKTLEEPPPHVKFLLATTEPQKLPITVLSRCLQFNLRRLSADQIGAHLERILQVEAVTAEAAAVGFIARAADGSMRDALSLLDQAIAYGGGKLLESETCDMLGTVDRSQVNALIAAIVAADGRRVFAIAAEMAAAAVDFADALAEMMVSLQRIAVMQTVPEIESEHHPDDAALASIAATVSPENGQIYYQIALQGRRDLVDAPDPRIGFEMTLVRMLAFLPADPSIRNPTIGDAGRSNPASAASSTRRTGLQSSTQPRPEAATPSPRRTTSTDTQPPHPPADDSPSVGEWAQMVSTMNLSAGGRELALNCTLDNQTDTTLRLRLSRNSGFLNTDTARKTLIAALSDLRGSPQRVVITLSEETQQTPASQTEQQCQQRQQQAHTAIHDDPGVRRLMNEFNARILPNSTRSMD